MSPTQSQRRRMLAKSAVGVSVIALAGAAALSVGVTSAGAVPAAGATSHKHDSFSFKLVPFPHIHACLPHAGGNVTITHTGINDTMTVSIHGMPPGTGFDLFVIQMPLKPFGVSWYQTDVQANRCRIVRPTR